MNENEFSIVGKGATYILVLMAFSSAFFNLYHGTVPSPPVFIVTIIGLVLFLVAKVSMISQGIKFSFGTGNMSTLMANLYRAGYWLMIVGFIATFAGYGT